VTLIKRYIRAASQPQGNNKPVLSIKIHMLMTKAAHISFHVYTISFYIYMHTVHKKKIKLAPKMRAKQHLGITHL
jgi:hypothetical protein